MAKVGRPPKINSPEEMQVAIDAYYADCEAKEIPLTVSGLAYAIDMTTECLRNYGTKDEYSVTVKRAKQKVETSIEAGILKGYNAAGGIFNLKNNFGWKDKSEQDLTVKVPKVIREQYE